MLHSQLSSSSTFRLILPSFLLNMDNRMYNLTCPLRITFAIAHQLQNTAFSITFHFLPFLYLIFTCRGTLQSPSWFDMLLSYTMIREGIMYDSEFVELSKNTVNNPMYTCKRMSVVVLDADSCFTCQTHRLPLPAYLTIS